MSVFVHETIQRPEIPGVGSSSFASSVCFVATNFLKTIRVIRGCFEIFRNSVPNFRERVANSKNYKLKTKPQKE